MGFGSQKWKRSRYVLKASRQRVPGSIAIHTQRCKIYWITFLPSAGHSGHQGYRLWWRQLPVQHSSLFSPSFPPASLPNHPSHWPMGPPPRKRVTTFHRLLPQLPKGVQSPAYNIPCISSHCLLPRSSSNRYTNYTYWPSLNPTPAFTHCFLQRELSSCFIPLLSPRMPFLLPYFWDNNNSQHLT